MHDAEALDDLTEEQLLDLADACVETARRAEVDLLRIAYQWAIVNSPDRLDPAESDKPGREKARRFGGAGVPRVTEFAAASLGARIGRSPASAGMLIADTLDLRHRHPELWARVEAGEVRASYARFVVGKTRDLSETEAGYVDASVAESADGRIPWSRFERLVDGKVAVAAPEAARAREERARRARFARKLREEAHGMGGFLIRADVAAIEEIDVAVSVVAEALRASMPDAGADERRVCAVLWLLKADRGVDLADLDLIDVDVADLMPVVHLYAHTYAGASAAAEADVEVDPETGPLEPVVRVEGHGPVTRSWLREVLGPSARFKVTPVIDLGAQAPVDAYEIPDRHRRAVHLMTPADVFPFAANIDRGKQVDHTVPYDPGGPPGQSRIGNYGPMTTRHHRIKTHGRWQVQQPFPGVYVWRDPFGAFYLVDHTGARRVRPPAHESATPPKPIVIEMWRYPLGLDFDAA